MVYRYTPQIAVEKNIKETKGGKERYNYLNTQFQEQQEETRKTSRIK